MASEDYQGRTSLVGLAAAIKALGDPTRLSIFSLIMEGIHCNCELAARLNLSLSLVSYHLHILREAGLVECERDAKDARWVYYSVCSQTLSELTEQLGHLLDSSRTQPRAPFCNPKQR